jgi:AcrR family transcriptional regulator
MAVQIGGNTQDRRARLLTLAGELVGEEDADALSMDNLCAAAGCSTGAFHEAFDDRGALLAALFEELSSRIGAAMAAAYAAERTWTDGVRAALSELLLRLEAQPAHARFLVVGSLDGNAQLRARRRWALATLARALEADSPPATNASTPAPFDGEAVAGAVAAVLHARLLDEAEPALSGLLGSLMGMIVLVRIGAEAAQAELLKQTPTLQ